MSTPKVVVLQSSDGEGFEIEESVAALSETINHLIEDDCTKTSISVPNVTSMILAKVIEYCKRHADADDALTATDDDLKAFDAEFVKVDPDTLLDLISAADYLKINSLVDLTCQTVANMIKGKTPEEMRMAFNVENDFTPDEEEEIRRENAWAFI